MVKLDVFDPAMCCSTGVCGPAVDPVLPRFAADLDWLRSAGIAVERFNLTQQPGAFAANRVVKAALDEYGTACLPLIIVNGSVASRGTYPDRDSLMRMAEIARYTTPTASPRSLSVLAVQSCCGPESVPGEHEAASGGNGGSKCC